MKAPKTTTTTEQPTALDTLSAITELALGFRYPGQVPSVSNIVRTVSAASRCLRYQDIDERISVENGVVLAVAKKVGAIA
jgi:hypothetical protein